MPIITDEKLKGNYGTAEVMALLSSACLVRPVAADTDIGVDLYCETVAKNQPFLHFWLQVKTGDQCTVLRDGATASCYFSHNELAYWGRQPVPVFAALVPTEWPPTGHPTIYIVDVTQNILEDNGPTLRSYIHWSPDSRSDVKKFLEEDVPMATARLRCFGGVVANIPTPEPVYIGKTPLVPVLQYEENIREQIRRTAAHAVVMSFRSRSGAPNADLDDKYRRFVRLLASIVKQYNDKDHWENHFCQGLAKHMDSNFEQAVNFYDNAVWHINDDADFRSHPDTEKLLHRSLGLQILQSSKRGLIQTPSIIPE